MESNKYKKHLIKTLNNKKSEYMPSISSISDLSLDGKNKKWSRRWNIGVQEGAESSHEDEERESTANSLDEVIDEFDDKVNDKEESSNSVSITKRSDSEEYLKQRERELEKYKNNVKERYKKAYQEKYRKLKELLKNNESTDNPEESEREVKAALAGLGFWPSYYKALKDAHNKDKLLDEVFNNSLSELISDGCYDLDTKNYCTLCKYNHIKDCADVCDKSNKVNSLDILVKKSKSGKVIDSFTVNLDPKDMNKKVMNSINISIKSKGTGRMEGYDVKKDRTEAELGSASLPPVYHIEPMFSSNNNGNPGCCLITKSGGSKQTQDQNNGDYIVCDHNSTPRRRVEVDQGNCQNRCVIETLKTQKSHNNVNCPSSGNCVKSLAPKAAGLPNTLGESSRLAKFELKPQSFLHGPRKPNVAPERCGNADFELEKAKEVVTNTQNQKDDVDRCANCDCSNGAEEKSTINVAFTKDGQRYNYCEEDIGSQYDQTFKFYDSVNTNSLGPVEVMSEQVNNLLHSDIKLHAFKINNKRVKVPLFLNIGSNDSVYAGQGFVSSTAMGLFKISVVEPIEPQVSIGKKLSGFIGMNTVKSPYCKCSNIDTITSFDTANSTSRQLFKNMMNAFGEYTGIPWLKGGKQNNQMEYEQMNKTMSSSTSMNENVCDFHKNLFYNKVDRTKFGKDLFCQIKFITTMSSDTPLTLAKDTFTKGANLSSFFNGFHEQILCVNDTRDLNKYDLYNNHNFTFIFRLVKGGKHGRNFTVLNTTSGQHLCIDLLTHDLKFEEESKFSKYLVPAIFKIISLPTMVEAVSKNVFTAPKQIVSHEKTEEQDEKYDQTKVERILRCPTHMSTTDQYVNVKLPVSLLTENVPSYKIRTVITNAD